MTQNFSSRWGLKDDSVDVKIVKFKHRLELILGKHCDAEKNDLMLLAYSLGCPIDKFGGYDRYQTSWWLDTYKYFVGVIDVPTLAHRLEVLFSGKILSSEQKKFISNLTNESNLGIRSVKVKDEWITYPAGEKMLDQKLVEKPLSYLENKPLLELNSALEHYSNNKPVESAEKSRRTLEEYLRYKLKKPKIGLQAAIKEMNSILKEKNIIPEHLRLALSRDFNSIDTHFNDSSKHNSETTLDEAEFLIYKVGLLINLFEKIDLKIKI